MSDHRSHSRQSIYLKPLGSHQTNPFIAMTNHLRYFRRPTGGIHATTDGVQTVCGETIGGDWPETLQPPQPTNLCPSCLWVFVQQERRR